jgi:hypothetical protein
MKRIVDLDAYAGSGDYLTIRHFNRLDARRGVLYPLVQRTHRSVWVRGKWERKDVLVHDNGCGCGDCES